MTSPHIAVDDTYTGHQEPQTAARRTLPNASIIKVSVGPMDNNAYLVTCNSTGKTLLIDAANDAEVLLDVIKQQAPELSLIVTSHQHFDHWQALKAVAEVTGAPTAAHSLDAEPLPVTPDRILADGDTITIGDLTFDVIHLQGHTEGSVALALKSPDGVTHLFTGDCLFPGGVGKTWQPGDFERLLGDAGIVRHGGKIRSTINNARRACDLIAEHGSLARYFWAYADLDDTPPDSVEAHTETSRQLSKLLKKAGWSFVGPTTIYAFMQAMGLVNNHFVGCDARDPAQTSRLAAAASVLAP